jgi:hypothetical protein
VNGLVVAIAEIVRETEVDLVNGIVVGIADLDLVTLGDLDLETLILYVLVDTRVVAGADLDLVILGDLDLETVTLVVLVGIMLVGRGDLVTETVWLLNTLTDLAMETVLEVVNERLGDIVLVFKGLFDEVGNLLVGIVEIVKVRVVVTEGVGIKVGETVKLLVEAGLLDIEDEYDKTNTGI